MTQKIYKVTRREPIAEWWTLDSFEAKQTVKGCYDEIVEPYLKEIGADIFDRNMFVLSDDDAMMLKLRLPDDMMLV